MKKILLFIFVLVLAVGILPLSSVNSLAKPVYREVYAVDFYHTEMWSSWKNWYAAGMFIVDHGSVQNGVLSVPTFGVTQRGEEDGAGRKINENMVFDFSRPTLVSSMTFHTTEDGQFPTEYLIQYRRPESYAPVFYKFDGMAQNTSKPIEDGFSSFWIIENFWPRGEDGSDSREPETGLPYREVSREGNTVTIELEEPILCVALKITTTENNTPPWSCAEAHFYGEYVRLLGDADGDGDTKANDAVRALLHSVSKSPLTDADVPYADVNGDGKVNAQDAVRILLHCVDKQPIPNQIPNGV